MAVLNPPLVSAFAWSVVEGETGGLLCGKEECGRAEIASLTKIMTAYTTLKLLRLMRLDRTTTALPVSRRAVLTIGTTAGLRAGDRLTVVQLLHGLLLPSGNDAAVVLAEGCGRLLLDRWSHKPTRQKLQRCLNIVSMPDSETDVLDFFVRCMNRLAVKLGLAKSCFSNPHGLADKGNKSTAADVGRLVHFAKRDALLATVVRTPEYSCIATSELGAPSPYTWANTNVLLREGYDGFKTGITPTAGPCLVATRTYRGVNLIITVLHCKNCEYRWKEVNALYTWATSAIDSIYASTPDEEINAKKLPLLFHKIM